MFPRIFFIFILILSPSYENESEGPSETECRPYIEKALQREGVTQERIQPADDVGEPPQNIEQVEALKDDLSSGEAIAGSDENLIDSGGADKNSGSSEETATTAQPEPESSSELDKSSLEVAETSIEAEESSGEQPASDIAQGGATESVEEAASGNSDEEATVASPEPVGNESVERSSEEAAQVNESPELAQIQESDAITIESVEEGVESPEVDETKETDVNESTENSVEEGSSPVLEEPVEPAQTLSEESSEQESSVQQADELETQASEVVSEEASVEELIDSTQSAEKDSAEGDAVEAEQVRQDGVIDESLQSSSIELESVEALAEVDSLFQESENVVVGTISSGEATVVESTSENQSEPSPSESKEELDQASNEVKEDQTVSENSEEATPEKEEDKPAESNLENIESPSQDSPVSTDNEQSAETDTLPETVGAESEEATLESTEGEVNNTDTENQSGPGLPEEELIMPIEIPGNLRTRDHLAQILKLVEENDGTETTLAKVAQNTLHDLKKIYDAAIKPLEILYKYRDLSNRHFGDPEIFSKPLILFMGPWSGGKSTIINYLLDNEFKNTALRSGAEPSPAYFNLVMWGEHEEILDGTQLAADWTFSGLQKFGQGLLDRLRGLRLKHPLLEKVNIVEIPGILEIRKQVERLFPFNDACQWFIDRADIIFLVYDPSKLDVGPETEAILDQLKGREMQTRIVLNKADQVKPEELMRVQGTLIWNISPLMSSTEPPVMYSTSLWSLPYEVGAPARLLYAQECSFLKDLREAIDKRVENKISSARRFAVRVRNHAKMVDCYLTTYYNHKTFFGNKKKVSDDIIEHPQNYHIYEGLSTLTNISRYDLPDPEVYKDFFRLNPVYEFQQLASTCTYFKGCPINRLDVAIAYDLPELIGKYKKAVESIRSTKK